MITLAGGSLGIAGPVCRLAREVAPSLVVLEDVDLVATERTIGPGGPLLFELLNELDGMADDADLAVELPLPDAGCRRRLFDLYAHGVQLDVDDLDGIIERTEGVTASFFRELLRQAALEAADDGSPAVQDEHLAAALDRLLTRTGALTKVLLGAARPSETGVGIPGPQGWLEATRLEIDVD